MLVLDSKGGCVVKLKAVVDRIEEDVAILLLGPAEIIVDFPLSCLPEVIREGMILDITLEIDKETEEARRQRATDLMQKLLNKQKAE